MHLRIFTTLAIFVIVTITSCQRDCPEITRADLEKILAEIIRLDAEETTINVTDFHPVCLAYSRERERYRYVSVVVEYTCRGSEDCPTISPAVEQIESQCIDGVWNRTAISSAQHTRTVSPAANFLTPTRSNCSFCLSPELITALALTYTADNTTHCVACDESCHYGLKRCFDEGSSGCCYYYNATSCVSLCQHHLRPNSESVCTCPNIGYTGHNCRERIDCGGLESPENGNVFASNTLYESMVNYSCSTGYTMTGDTSRTCLYTGLWSGSEPTCTVIDCGSPGDLDNGNVSVFTTTYKSVATYSCKTGYTLIGNVSQTCLDTGLWSNTKPTCTACPQGCIKCDSDVNRCDNCSEFYPVFSEFLLECTVPATSKPSKGSVHQGLIGKVKKVSRQDLSKLENILRKTSMTLAIIASLGLGTVVLIALLTIVVAVILVVVVINLLWNIKKERKDDLKDIHLSNMIEDEDEEDEEEDDEEDEEEEENEI